MGILLLAAVVVVLALIGLRSFAGADPKLLAKYARSAGALFLVAVAALFAVTGRFAFAGLVLAASWFVANGRRLPFSRPHAGDLPRGRSSTRMTRAEAYEVLGLEPGANDEAVRAAHRRLILQNHPDKGGSDYLASKINEAKDILLAG